MTQQKFKHVLAGIDYRDADDEPSRVCAVARAGAFGICAEELKELETVLERELDQNGDWELPSSERLIRLAEEAVEVAFEAVVEKFDRLREQSEQAWEAAIESACVDEQNGNAGKVDRVRSAFEEWEGHWDDAKRAFDRGAIDDADIHLTLAASEAREHGDDSFEREALSLIGRGS